MEGTGDLRRPGRIPLPPDEIVLLDEAGLTAQTCRRVLDFNRAYQQRELRQFLKMKYDWEESHPGKMFPGLCAEVDSITGLMRPLVEQRAWTWGDARALGLWAAFLIKGRIDGERHSVRTASGRTHTVNLKTEYEAYCDRLYTCLVGRYEACGGSFPFVVDVETNCPSNDARNHIARPHEASASEIFCLNAMVQYAMLRHDNRALDIGLALLDRCCAVARTGAWCPPPRPGHRSQGYPMVTVGAIVDILKTIHTLESRGNAAYSHLKPILTERAREIIDDILTNHYDPATHKFWEENGPDGKAFINEKGQHICDPGHTAEACGFFAELCGMVAEDAPGARWRWSRTGILSAILEMNHLVTTCGYSERGAMFKNIDLRTGHGVPDVSGGGAAAGRATAPWWNVREHAAASIRLYVLTDDERCLEGYRKAFNATYLHYPNQRIGGLMVQTLDPYTLEPLDVHPATGNLDAMHTGRSREREIEALEALLPRCS